MCRNSQSTRHKGIGIQNKNQERRSESRSTFVYYKNFSHCKKKRNSYSKKDLFYEQDTSMSLANYYRPKTFADVIGQEHIT